MPSVLAAADIGSNTAHLLVATIGPAGIRRLVNDSVWLSLGEVVSHTGEIPPDYVDRLVAALETFKRESLTAGAESLYVFATEAVRKAGNHGRAVREIRRQTGLDVQVLPPRREAELGLKGALLDCPVAGRFVFAETGGGSVQIALCDGPEILDEYSAPIGTGVLMDKAGLTFPTMPGQVQKVESEIKAALDLVPFDPESRPIVACGGVARGLWRALHPDGEKTIHRQEIAHLAWATQRLNIETISTRYSVKPKRAATLLPGALVYRAIMDKSRADEIQVSQFGVREGAVLEVSQGKVVPCPL